MLLNLGLFYPHHTNFDLVGYPDVDFASYRLDRKSTSGTCQFLGYLLISRHNNKHNFVALFIAKAKYAETGSYCAQILYMKQELLDFDVKFSNVPILCDNTNAINLF